jgi:hypothetical protein
VNYLWPALVMLTVPLVTLALGWFGRGWYERAGGAR